MVISFYNSREDYIKHLNYSNILISKVLSILFVLFLFLKSISMILKFKGLFMIIAFFTALIICFLGYIICKFALKMLNHIFDKLCLERNLNKVLSNYPNMIGNKIIEINNDKLIIISNDERLEYDYPKLFVNTSHKDIIDIAYDKKILCTIPISVFKSNDEKDEFVNLLKERIKSSKQN